MCVCFPVTIRVHDKYDQSFKVDSVSMVKHRYEVINRIIVLNDFYPQNAQHILSVYTKNRDEKLALQMLDAVDLRLMNNRRYQAAVDKMQEKLKKKAKNKNPRFFRVQSPEPIAKRYT